MSITEQVKITTEQLIEQFGISAPAGKAQINSNKSKRTTTDTIYCVGDAWIYGQLRTPLRLSKGIYFPSGSADAPGIAFDDDRDTGFYLSADGTIGVASNGTNIMNIGENVEINSQITTGQGDLVLSPAGENIDCTGHQLINVGGVSITVGEPNDVIINNEEGVLSSEPHLAPSRGGTGVDSGEATGVAKVVDGTWGFSQITEEDFGEISYFTTDQLIVNTILSDGAVNFSPANGEVDFDTSVICQSGNEVSGGRSCVFAANISTNSNTATTLFALPEISGEVNVGFAIHGLITLCSISDGTSTGMFSFYAKGKYLAGAVSVSTFIQQGSILDSGLSTATVTATTSGQRILIQVIGIDQTIINWMGKFDVIRQNF